MNDVFALLPKSEDEITQAAHQSQKPGEVPPAEVAGSGRVEDIARALNEEVYRVQDALDKLHEDTHRVQTIDMAEDPRYYRA